MAGYECNVCESDKQVTLLMTSLVTGQTMASCEDDIPVALIGLLATTLQVDGQRLYDAVKRFTDREAKSAAKADAQAAEKAVPSPAAQEARQDWIDGQGGEDAIKHRMTDPLLAGQEGE